MARIISDALMQALKANGIAPDDTRRVVIDITNGNPPIIYVEKYGDEKLIAIIEALATVKIEKV